MRNLLIVLTILCASTIASAQTYNEATGNYYQVVNTPMSWVDARDAAEQMEYECMEGHLVTVNSFDENRWITDTLPGAYAGLWLGGFQAEGAAEPAGGWQWVTGEPFSPLWVLAEPTNSFGYENALRFDHLNSFPQGFGWNDYNEDALLGYVVEFESGQNGLTVYTQDVSDANFGKVNLYVENNSIATISDFVVEYYLTYSPSGSEVGPELSVWYSPDAAVSMEHMGGQYYRIVFDYYGTSLAPGEQTGSLSIGFNDPSWDFLNFSDDFSYHANTNYTANADVSIFNGCGLKVAGSGPDFSDAGDIDEDGIANGGDNCVFTFNPLQNDFDKDGKGDICDDEPCTDADSDGFCAELDDCDDADDEVNPAQVEICDGKDNNCAASLGVGFENQVHSVPVVVLTYIPEDEDGKIAVDEVGQTPWTDDAQELREIVVDMSDDAADALTEGSRFRGYKNSDASASLDYQVVDVLHFNNAVPRAMSAQDYVTDGDPETGKWGIGKAPYDGKWLTVDLGSIMPVSSATLSFWYIDRPVAYTISVSETGAFNGEQIVVVEETNAAYGFTILSGTSIQQKSYAFSTGAINARYVRIEIQGNDIVGPSTQSNLYEFGLDVDMTNAVAYASDVANLPTGAPADHMDIMTNDIDVCDLVDNQGIKEIWLWMHHDNYTYPVESYQKSPIQSLGNGYMVLPECVHTYSVYNYNFARSVNEAVHNHMHHLESLYSWTESSLFWTNLADWVDEDDGVVEFADPDARHCGNGHYPPNAEFGYDYANETLAMSDCENWIPFADAPLEAVNCETWGGYRGCNSCNDNNEDKGCTELAYYIWWMQNLPGYDNGIRFDNNTKEMRNFWDLVGDFDNAAVAGQCLGCDLVWIDEDFTEMCEPEPVETIAIEPYNTVTLALTAGNPVMLTADQWPGMDNDYWNPDVMIRLDSDGVTPKPGGSIVINGQSYALTPGWGQQAISIPNEGPYTIEIIPTAAGNILVTIST